MANTKELLEYKSYTFEELVDEILELKDNNAALVDEINELEEMAYNQD